MTSDSLNLLLDLVNKKMGVVSKKVLTAKLRVSEPSEEIAEMRTWIKVKKELLDLVTPCTEQTRDIVESMFAEKLAEIKKHIEVGELLEKNRVIFETAKGQIEKAQAEVRVRLCIGGGKS